MNQYVHARDAPDSRRYEAIVQTYEQLTEMVLNTMRLEIRGRVVCNLSAALQKVSGTSILR